MIIEEVAEDMKDKSEEQPTEPVDSAEKVSFLVDTWPIILMYVLNLHGGNVGKFLKNYDDLLK